MIKPNNPEQGLQPHQQEAYEEVKKAFETGNRAAVIMPTGCGKSFVPLQLMEDNREKRILFLLSSRVIRKQIYEYIAKYVVGEEPTVKKSARKIAEGHFPNLKVMLYQNLLRVSDELMTKINPDIIIMDELHRIGADKWGERVDKLLEINPEAKVLGTTATPERTDDVDVIDKTFENNINYELTLMDALVSGIIMPQDVVKCDYAISEEIGDIKKAIEECENEDDRNELLKIYEDLRRIIEKADDYQTLFEKNITRKDGKYIVFCKSKEHMDEVKEKLKEWFVNIDKAPEIYEVYSEYGLKDEKTIDAFRNSKSEHLKLLLSINKLNEGIHIEDLAGVIMLRPTKSKIVYLQQLGRALSSDENKAKTIVFDMVNNYLLANMEQEILRFVKENGTKAKTKKSGDVSNDENVVEEPIGTKYADILKFFKIQGETKPLLDLLEDYRNVRARSKYLINARAIKKWMEERDTTKTPSQYAKDIEERKLGNALQSIKQNLIKPYLNLQTEKEREEYQEQHPELEEVLQIVKEIDENNISSCLRNARAIKQWMEERKTTKPPAITGKDEEEKRLGRALQSIKRNLIKPYLNLQTEKEREDYRERHQELEEVMKIIKEIDENNISSCLRNARAIKQWMEERKTTKPPSTIGKDIEEKRLGRALQSIKQNLIKPYLNLQTEKDRKDYREQHPELEEVLQIVKEIDENNISTYLRNIKTIKKWMEERDTTKPPAISGKDEEEKRLGKALNHIKQNLIKPYLNLQTEKEREEYQEQHPELEEVLQIVKEIDENKIPPYLRNARAIKKWMEERDTTKTPSQYAKDIEERKLGNALQSIKQNLIKPYLNLQTEKEREEYQEQHPELEEAMQIVFEINLKSGRKSKNQKLALLIQEDLEKRRILAEAKELEAMYQQQLRENGIGHSSDSKDIG